MNVGIKTGGAGALAAMLLMSGCAAEERGVEEVAPDVPVEIGVADEYPLDTCVVTGQELGSMGEPVEVEHEGRKVLLCCAGCVGAFEADPERYVQKLDEAEDGEPHDDHHGHDHDH